MAIKLTGYIEISERELSAVLKHLPHHIASTRAAFDAHQKRTGSSSWAAATVTAKRHYRITEI